MSLKQGTNVFIDVKGVHVYATSDPTDSPANRKKTMMVPAMNERRNIKHMKNGPSENGHSIIMEVND